jgi:prepilin-type N-terminal cleavage/methylation domain-containing protein
LTLLEVLISMVLFGIIMSATYAALVLAMRYSNRTHDTATIQRETLTSVNRIERALATAAYESVEINLAQDALCFVSAESPAGIYTHDPATGQPYYFKHVCFYRRQSGLYQKIRPVDPTDPTRSVPNLPSPNVTPDVLINDPTLPEILITDKLSKLIFREGTALGLELGLTSQGNPPNGMEVVTRVFLRL